MIVGEGRATLSPASVEPDDQETLPTDYDKDVILTNEGASC
jgi:hypothetical protein